MHLLAYEAALVVELTQGQRKKQARHQLHQCEEEAQAVEVVWEEEVLAMWKGHPQQEQRQEEAPRRSQLQVFLQRVDELVPEAVADVVEMCDEAPAMDVLEDEEQRHRVQDVQARVGAAHGQHLNGHVDA